MMASDFPFTVITADGSFQGRFKDGEDVIEVKEINLEPNYENTAKFLGEAICQGVHDKPYLALWSLLDQMRYLTQADLPAALRVVEHFGKLHENYQNNVVGVPPEVGGEDDFLEEAYEDRYGYPDEG